MQYNIYLDKYFICFILDKTAYDSTRIFNNSNIVSEQLEKTTKMTIKNLKLTNSYKLKIFVQKFLVSNIQRIKLKNSILLNNFC